MADDSPYAIFTSYACYDGRLQNGSPFRKFCKTLSELVGAKVTTARTRLSFVDSSGIKAGDDWEAVLVDGVRTAEVIVCLVSNRYLESQWCGRELEVFDRRVSHWRNLPPASGHPGRFIFPIWWEKPKDRTTLPGKLGVYMPDDPGFPKSYREQGLRSLLSLRKTVAVQQVADALSDRIAETLNAPPSLVPGHAIPNFRNFPSAFEKFVPDTRPYQVECLPGLPDGTAWKAEPNGPDLATLLDRLAGKIQVTIRPFAIAGDPADIPAGLSRRRALPLLIADAAAPANDMAINLINRLELRDLAVVAVHTSAGNATSPTSDAWVARFPEGSLLAAARAGRIALTGPRDLDSTLEAIITRARQQMILHDTPVRAEDPAISAAASEAGIPIELKPNLEGPTAPKVQQP